MQLRIRLRVQLDVILTLGRSPFFVENDSVNRSMCMELLWSLACFFDSAQQSELPLPCSAAEGYTPPNSSPTWCTHPYPPQMATQILLCQGLQREEE